MNREQAEQLLKTATGLSAATFRRGQWEAVDAVVNQKQKLLVVERTGWGKSIVYFISTRILRNQGRGPTIVISPLLALMRNQIAAAERLGLRADTINSTNPDDWEAAKTNILNNQTDLLLVSPERLANDRFMNDALMPVAGRVGLLVVDEAHCISDWGHDFRPDYRRIVNILHRMPRNMPVLGTTATANNRVVRDVQTQLGNIAIQRGPLTRKSLHLQTLRLSDQAERLAWLVQNIPNLPGTGIVYSLTTRDAELAAGWLQQNGINARAYYSDVKHEDFPDSNAYRLYLEEIFLENRLKVLVATTALGMGYDKPDIGFVVHYQAPGSIVAYYQQVGRAGRAIKQAYGILLAGREDEDIHDYFRRTAFPDENQVREILSALEDHEELSVVQIQEYINLNQGQINKVLKLLSVENPAPVIKVGSKWRRTPVPFQLDRDRIHRLTRQKEIEWNEVQEYIDTKSCLMNFLQRALDDEDEFSCGQCANCSDEALLPAAVEHKRVVVAKRFLRHSEAPLRLKKQVAAGAFPEYGFRGRLAAELQAEEGRILSRWGDAGWGQQVAENKHSGHFSDELVEAAAELVLKRWQPVPLPRWVTCVPSLNHPELVPDFSKRLAGKLGIPFLPAAKKVRQNQPQKFMQNRFHQCHNLDGAFTVGNILPGEPVLLIDDIVDSGWTLTVLSALLLQAGSGPVFPLVLASTTQRTDHAIK